MNEIQKRRFIEIEILESIVNRERDEHILMMEKAKAEADRICALSLLVALCVW